MNIVFRRIALAAAVALFAAAGPHSAQAQFEVNLHGANFGIIGATWQANSSQGWRGGTIGYYGIPLGAAFACCTPLLSCSYTASFNGSQQTSPVQYSRSVFDEDLPATFQGEVLNSSPFYFTGATINTRIPVQVKLRCEYDVFGSDTYINALASTYKMTFEVLITGTQ